MSSSFSRPAESRRLPLPAARAPEPLGLRRTFGFGDRIGLAAAGHVSAARRFSIAPVLAQLTPRDLARTSVPVASRLAHIAGAAAAAHFTRAWGADAHGVKTEADIEAMAAGGVTWFTIDPSAFVENRADLLSADELAEELAILGKEGVVPPVWLAELSASPLEIEGAGRIEASPAGLGRAAVKFGRALHHAQRLARHVSTHSRHTPVDLELALTESSTAATLVEHAFIALHARRRGIPLTALALRWDAGIEPAAEFEGDGSAFEAHMCTHAAIARQLGPYKVSVHHGADTLGVLPGLARACGEALHIKTIATTYLTGLRIVCRTAPELFREIADFARHHFERERLPHLVSTTQSGVDRLFRGPALATLETSFLDTRAGRQVLDTASASVLQSGATSRGRPFREAILEILHERRDDHIALLDAVFSRQLELMNEG